MILITKIETQRLPDHLDYVQVALPSDSHHRPNYLNGTQRCDAVQLTETVQPRRFQTVGGTRRLIAMTSEVEKILEMPFDAWDTLQREREEAIKLKWNLSNRLQKLQKSPWWRRLLWSLTLNEGWLWRDTELERIYYEGLYSPPLKAKTGLVNVSVRKAIVLREEK